jgi:hypothetical protein
VDWCYVKSAEADLSGLLLTKLRVDLSF